MNDPAHLRITSRISMDYVVSIYSAILLRRLMRQPRKHDIEV